MTPGIRTAVALGPDTERDAIEAAFLAAPSIVVTGFVPARPDVVATLGDDHEALVVACMDEDEENTLDFVMRAVRARPDRPVVVVHEGTNNGFVRKAFDAGVDDLVSGTLRRATDGALARDVGFALEKAVARRTGSTDMTAPSQAAVMGEMIVVLGPKGGTGKTLTSCNLSAALAQAGKRVILVDLDLQFGDVGLALGLPPERTIYELATAGGSLDSQKVEDFLTTHESGVRVLLAPRRPDHAAAVTTPFLRELFTMMREITDFVIVDTPPTFTPDVIAAIDRSTGACLVAMLDALSLKNSKLALETLELMEYDPSRIQIVLNRADSRVGVTPEDVSAILGRRPDVQVPSTRDITRSVNEAKPIVMTRGNADARRAFEMLAEGYLPRPAKNQNTSAGASSRGRLRRRAAEA